MKYWWLWKNFVNGNPEYWAFDHLYPINMDNGDPQVLGEPCGYALFKPSRPGRTVCPADEQRAINFAASSAEHQRRVVVDWLGLALELEAQAKCVESQTVERAMLAAAHGLRLMGAKEDQRG